MLRRLFFSFGMEGTACIHLLKYYTFEMTPKVVMSYPTFSRGVCLRACYCCAFLPYNVYSGRLFNHSRLQVATSKRGSGHAKCNSLKSGFLWRTPYVRRASRSSLHTLSVSSGNNASLSCRNSVAYHGVCWLPTRWTSCSTCCSLSSRTSFTTSCCS